MVKKLYIQSDRVLHVGEQIHLSIHAVVIDTSPDGTHAEVELSERVLASRRIE
jgi:hypothetical protein